MWGVGRAGAVSATTWARDQGPGWRVRRRRLPGTGSLPGPEPAARTLPVRRGSYASLDLARPAAADWKVGAAPRGSRAASMNAPRRGRCQGTGKAPGPTPEPLVTRI